MIDKIVRLADNTTIYILDEIDYKNKKFIYGVECDKEKEILKENYFVLEVKVKDDALILDNINDIEIESVVNNIFLSRVKELKNDL